MTRDERIAHYRELLYHRIGGWLRHEICDAISVIGTIQEHHSVHGNIVEFGVHHGKFLLLLDALRESDERTIAVDLFDAQELSAQNPELESENLPRFRDNIGLLPRDWRTPAGSLIEIIARDTLSYRPGELSNVKFFSVDAGHTAINAFNDLVIAQEALVPGGIIAFDDFFCPAWPGATEGFYNFMLQANRRLKPLFYYKGKMFLTTASEHLLLFPEYIDLLQPVAPEAVVRTFFGHPCLVMSWEGF